MYICWEKVRFLRKQWNKLCVLMFEPWPGEKEHLMAIPGGWRCGLGSCFLAKFPLDKRDHGPKHQEGSLHIFKTFDEACEANRPQQGASMHRKILASPDLERRAFDASKPRFVGELRGALARRPLWDTRTLFQTDFIYIYALEVKTKDLVR